MDIQQEYADAIGDIEHINYLNVLREVAKLRVTMDQVYVCATVLERSFGMASAEPYIKFFAQQLNLLTGASLPFPLDNKEKFIADIEMCLRRSKGILINLELTEISLKNIKGRASGEQPTYEYFQSALITLSDVAGYHLTDNITVLEFANRIKRLSKK